MKTKTILLVSLVAALLLGGCNPAAFVPVLSTVDAVGRGLSRVLGWCDDHGVDAAKLAEAKKVAESKDYQQALVMAVELVSKARAAGEPVPEDIEVMLRLAEGAMAAQAIQDGMRALSGTAVSK